jgi:hypothetical protein
LDATYKCINKVDVGVVFIDGNFNALMAEALLTEV